MKLAVYFGLDTTPFVVTWNRDLMDFYHYFNFDDEDWQWAIHDKDSTYLGGKVIPEVDCYLLYTKTKTLPCDINGAKIIVPDFRIMFGIYLSAWKKCECGAEKIYGKNTGHATWCPLWSKV